MAKILIAVPTYRGKNYCWVPFLANVCALQAHGHEIDYLVADNSPDTHYVEYLRSYGLNCRRVPPKATVQATLADTHNAIRDYFLKNAFDWLLHVESDLFPPTQSLQTLLDLDVPVSAGIYFLSTGYVHNPCLFVTQQIGHETIMQSVDRQYMASWIDGYPKQVYAAGLGFSLIHREVARQIPFRHVPNSHYHPDMFFYEDCYNLNIPVIAHTGLIIPHQNQDWQSNYQYIKNLKTAQ